MNYDFWIYHSLESFSSQKRGSGKSLKGWVLCETAPDTAVCKCTCSLLRMVPLLKAITQKYVPRYGLNKIIWFFENVQSMTCQLLVTAVVSVFIKVSVQEHWTETFINTEQCRSTLTRKTICTPWAYVLCPLPTYNGQNENWHNNYAEKPALDQLSRRYDTKGKTKSAAESLWILC